MKKMLLLVGGLMLATSVNAASVSWKFTSNNADAGSTVYVLLGTASTSFTDVSEVQDASIANSLLKTSRGTTTALGVASDSAFTVDSPSYYYVVVNSDEKGYWVSDKMDAPASAFYEPPASAPMTTVFSAPGALTYTDFAPEPTSGILLMIGGALLALRRKQK